MEVSSMTVRVKFATISFSGLLFAGVAAADIVRWDSTNNPQLPWFDNAAYFRFDTGQVFAPAPPGPDRVITTGPGLVGVDVGPAESTTCNFLNSGGVGLSTFGARMADQGVAPVSFGQMIDGSLPYTSQLIRQIGGPNNYFAVKFFPNPTATIPNYGWIQGVYCDILTTNVVVVAFGYNTIPGQPIAAGAAAQVSTPPVLLAGLIALVQDMNLKQGISNSLDAKLQDVQGALAAAQNGDLQTACNQMNAFINEVNAQIGKSISQAQANELLSLAGIIKSALGCTG